MSAIPLPYVQNTPEWIDARRDSIGSSDLPVITGNSPYRSSPFDLWCYKTRLLEPAPIDPATQELFDLGHALEPVIAERYTVLTDRPVRRVNRVLKHHLHSWATASLDRVSAVKGERRIVELKWVPWRRWAEGPEPVPAYVQDQVQWQLMVTGYDVADVAVLNGSRVEYHEVGPSDTYQADLLYLAADFHASVKRGERPALDGSEATRRALMRLYPRDDGRWVDPTPELEALVRALRPAQDAEKAADLEVGRIKNSILGILETAAGSENETWKAKAEGLGWKVQATRSADGVRTDHKAVASAFRKYIEAAGVSSELEAELDAIESLHQAPTEGTRSVRAWYRGQEEASWT